MTAPESAPADLVLALRPVAADVRAARAFAVRELTAFATSGEPAEDFLDAVATITSELATNAINAGAALIRLTLSLRDDHVLLSITDDADGVVAIPAHDPLALNGRGLRIIDTLSRAWGVDTDPDGKRVWAELHFPTNPGPRPAATT